MPVLTFLLAHWRTTLVLLLIAGIGGYAGLMRLERDHYRAELTKEHEAFITFKAEVKAAGEAQQKRSEAIAAHDELLKEEADHDHEVALTKLRTDVERVRRERDSARSSVLPPAPAASVRPDLFCLDRAEYQREDGAATERLRAGARSLADEGTTSTVDLDSAKRWASDSDGRRRTQTP